jgi:hypothetical protein
LHFADNKILGITALSKDRACFTMDLVARAGAISEKGLAFWQNVFAGNTEAAHKSLASGVQQQLSLSDFSELVDSSGISELATPQALQPAGVRFVERIDRSLPVMLVAYYVAELADGTRQPLCCEFGLATAESDSADGILNFKTEFVAAFPVSDYGSGSSLVRALQSAQASALLALISDKYRAEVNQAILSGFLGKMQATLGRIDLPEHMKVIHEYAPDGRLEYLKCLLPTEARSIPLTAVFEYGALRSFTLQSPEMSYFLDAISDDSAFYQTIEQFMRAWADRNIESTIANFVVELRTEDVRERLRQLWDTLELEHGGLREFQVVDLKRSKVSNLVLSQLQLKFERGVAEINVELQVDAFGAHIAGVESR